jgi:uncharacterized membrane protein
LTPAATGFLTNLKPMGPLDAAWHLLNLFVPAVGTAMIAAGLAKLAWRRELSAVPWKSLALAASLGAAGVTVAGLVVFGRDGKMATYGAMVLAIALTLWWRGFLRRR